MLVVLVQEVTARVQGADQQRLSVCLLVGRFVGQNELKTTLLVTRAIVRRCGVSVCVISSVRRRFPVSSCRV